MSTRTFLNQILKIDVTNRTASLFGDTGYIGILADPNHIVWKIILLCVLILGGGSAVGVDVISTSGLTG